MKNDYILKRLFLNNKESQELRFTKHVTLSLKLWYRLIKESFVTTDVDAEVFRFAKRCKIELEYPDIDKE